MLKKLLCFSFIFFFYLLFNSTNCLAIEYCHIYKDDILQETLELPFYFYTITRHTDLTTSMPTITYNHTTTYVDSLTKCELINQKIINPFQFLIYDAKIYHTTKTAYPSSITSEKIFDNAKYWTDTSTLRGYSSIEDKQPPKITGYKEYYKTNIDRPIDISVILSNIMAYDDRDGNITDQIIIEYNEYENNITKLGIYPIILSVEDSASNKTSITIYIEIIDTTLPIIEGKQSYISSLSSPLTIEEIKINLIATDNADGDLTPQIYVCEDTYSPNKNKIGLYDLYFCVMDNSNNTSTPFKTVIEVKDDIIPIIEGLDYYTSKLSNPLTLKQIMYSLAAIDNEQDISNKIFVTNDYYSAYLNTLGEKHIYFQVMDDSSNLSEPFKVTVNLIDDVSPQIFGLDTYSSFLSSPLSLTYLKQQLTVLDNYDGNISSRLEIIEDTYSNNINKTGTYNITFQASDYSSNLSETFKITITNIDDVAPTITGPNLLQYALANKPTLDNILSEYTIKDNIDKEVELNIDSDSYSNSLTTGTYYVTLSCIDSSNNKSVPFTIKIEVVDIILKLNEISISLPTSKLFPINEINKIINLDVPYTMLENTYTPNYNNVGTYKITYELEDNSTIIVSINTYEPTKEETKTETKKETFFSKVKSFFTKIINKIKNIFKNFKLLYIYLKYPQ